MIYTTNAVESLNKSLRKVIKTRGSFPNQEAAMKLLYLALEQIEQEVDNADPELESRVAALRDSAGRPRCELKSLAMKNSDEEHIWMRNAVE